MTEPSKPRTMDVWRYMSAAGGIEANLKLHHDAPLPTPTAKDHLIQVLAVGLNPVDYKPAESAAGAWIAKKPATPGFDFCGRIITPAAAAAAAAKNTTPLQAGDLVYGTASANPLNGGALAQYIAAPADRVVRVPKGMSAAHAAGAPVGAMTAHAALAPYISARGPSSRVFLNGGSGGVGTYAIQIAKALGAHVTVSCSARNADLCRALGADEVLDYNASPLLKQLQACTPFDHVVDNVFNDPQLYFMAHTYTVPSAKFAEVASGPSLAFLKFAARGFLLPGALGGGKRKFVLVMGDGKASSLEKLTGWFESGTVKTVVDSEFAWDQVVEAYKRQKTGRAVGKVIVNVAV